MKYCIIYDGNCNLCVTFTKLLEQFDQGKLFKYIPMQAEATLQQWGITPLDCQQGMILIDATNPERKWQGSEAAEEIVKIMPFGEAFIAAYRLLPGAKWLGDKTYEQIRDNRYQWFGSTKATYYACEINQEKSLTLNRGE